ncbi:MAG: HDOD domain-containing protein [Verrucomicrobiota bacterium]|nr:HDOD domain-containing protein [Verrucomicrobiota bacterium]
MSQDLAVPVFEYKTLSRSQIETRVQGCARLPSLRSIESALRELLNADQRYTAQISEVIRRDPSLTARLLRLVNSVYYGLTTPVNSIEEAVFYLGVRQIRQLSMVTPIIEDFQKLAGKAQFPWRPFWQHCIATAILTREVGNVIGQVTDEADYVAGLIHDVGKIVMASAFPEAFAEIYRRVKQEGGNRRAIELEVLGMDHTELGAIYLEHHHLPRVMVITSKYHHNPEAAPEYANIVASVQIADLLVRHAGIGDSGTNEPVAEADWLNASGWNILFPGSAKTERSIARAALQRSLDRLPTILEGLV